MNELNTLRTWGYGFTNVMNIKVGKLDAFHFELSWSLSNPLLLCKLWDCFGHGLPIRIINVPNTLNSTIGKPFPAHMRMFRTWECPKPAKRKWIQHWPFTVQKYNFPPSIQHRIRMDLWLKHAESHKSEGVIQGMSGMISNETAHQKWDWWNSSARASLKTGYSCSRDIGALE